MSVYTPQSIKDLRTFLESKGGTCSIARFCEPSSGRGFRGYHLGKAQIFAGGKDCPPSGKDDYSIQNARDKAGLTDARAAIDIQFGKKRLQDFSKWLVKQAQSNAPGTADMREIIYSPDGLKVLRYDRERGVNSAPRAGEADNTHLWHTHVSFYRDSENRTKVPTFSGYFQATPPPVPPLPVDPVPPEDESLKAFSIPLVPTLVMVPTGVKLYDDSAFQTAVWLVDPGRDMDYLGEPVPGATLIGYVSPSGERGFLAEDGVSRTNKAYFAKTGEVQNIRRAPQTDTAALEQQLQAATELATQRDNALTAIETTAKEAP